MNLLISWVLVVIAIAWLVYLFGLRDKRFAFTLWFPLTAAALLGTMVWLWAASGLILAPRGGGEATGWAAFGATIILCLFLVCPILLGISLWQRPKSGSYSLAQCVPIVIVCGAFLMSYRWLASGIENQQLQLTILDTQKQPVANVTVLYQSHEHPLKFSFPSPERNGQAVSGANGIILLPAPETHEIEYTLKKEGYASLRVRMDRALDQFVSRHIWIDWQFPADDPKQPWKFHGGTVAQDVDKGGMMHLTVYLPKTNAEQIPTYAPVRVYSVSFGQITFVTEPANPLIH